jgi:hypothetical protein
MAQITNPPLTTIDQPKYETGKAAMEILLKMMPKNGVREPEHRIIGVHLIERQSCKPVSASSARARVAASAAILGAPHRRAAATHGGTADLSGARSAKTRRRKLPSL